VLIPLGSTEQHGPHLPLDTDTRIASAVAAAVAARHEHVAVAPALAYGASGEHQGFAGTLSIGQAALELVLVELVRSIGPEVSRAILVNGHGGNVEAIGRAVATLDREQRPVDVWSPRLEGGDTHAGRVETSLLLALAPEVVRLDRAEAGVTTPLTELLPALRAGGLAAVTPNGVLGDPTGASAAEGRTLLASMVEDLDRLVGSGPPDGRDRRVGATAVARSAVEGHHGAPIAGDERNEGGR
jgi:creatinine amidohydrolase